MATCICRDMFRKLGCAVNSLVKPNASEDVCEKKFARSTNSAEVDPSSLAASEFLFFKQYDISTSNYGTFVNISAVPPLKLKKASTQKASLPRVGVLHSHSKTAIYLP